MKRVLVMFALVFLLSACEQADTPEPTPEPPVTDEETSEVSATGPEEACSVSVGWDPWEPYHFIGAGGDLQGLDIELVSALAERADCDLEFVQGSWAGLLRLIQDGKLDLLLGATITPEREEFAWFSEPYRQERFSLYVRANEHDRWSGQELAELLEGGFRLGVTQGFIYSDEISQMQSDPDYSDNFVEAAVGELNFTHLMDHRIDGFLEDPFVFAAIDRRRNWGTEMQPLDDDFGSGEVHLLFSRESVDKDLVERFNEALGELRASSEYEQIMSNYREH